MRGVRIAGTLFVLYRFYSGAQSGGTEAYTGGATTKNTPFSWDVYKPQEINRSMGWASDAWTTTDGLSFRILTPFGPVADPLTIDDDELKKLICPAILAEITVTNTEHDTDAWAFFGVGGKRTASSTFRHERQTKGSGTGICLGLCGGSES